MTTPSQGAAGRPVIFVFAHPDDEAFCAAGTMAALLRRDTPITLVCATRGEAGEISDPALATPETLGTVREGELRAAMRLVGVDDVRFLDYRDSGMEGTAENEDPRAFVRAPRAEVVARLVAIIQELRPGAVVTFGPDGFYGHPDHIYAYEATTEAVQAAANGSDARWQVPALYYSSISRERIQERATHRQGPFAEMSPERLAKIGTPQAEITTVLDVGDFYSLKEEVLREHRTQFGPDGPLRELPSEEIRAWLSKEHYVRAHLPWDNAASDHSDPIGQLTVERGTTPN